MIIRTGAHGWLLRSPDWAFVIVLRRLYNPAQPVERFVDERARDPHGLLVGIFGEIDRTFLDPIERALAGGIEMRARYVAVAAEQYEDRHLHLGLKQIERIANHQVVNFAHVIHRFIPSAVRRAAQAPRGAA